MYTHIYTHIFKLIHDFRYLPERWALCWSIFLGHTCCLNWVETQTQHPPCGTSKRNWRQRKSVWQNETLKTERDAVMVKGELLSSPGLVDSPAYSSLPREREACSVNKIAPWSTIITIALFVIAFVCFLKISNHC